MPITVICPGCRRRLTVGDDRAGTTFACPKCSVAISVPVIVGGALPPVPTPAPLPLPPPTVIDYKPEPEPDHKPDPHYRPRRRRKRGHTTQWVVLGLVLLLVGAAVGWAASRWSRDRVQPPDSVSHPRSEGRASTSGVLPLSPDMTGDGPDWTYQELLDHLRAKGLKVWMIPCGGGQLYAFGAPDSDESALNAQIYYDHGHAMPYWAVLCNKKTSAKEAKEAAGRHEQGTFYWGRYYFYGLSNSKAFLAIRKVLLGE